MMSGVDEHQIFKVSYRLTNGGDIAEVDSTNVKIVSRKKMSNRKRFNQLKIWQLFSTPGQTPLVLNIINDDFGWQHTF